MDKERFDIFRREVLRCGRMSKENLDIPNAELLEKLNTSRATNQRFMEALTDSGKIERKSSKRYGY